MLGLGDAVSSHQIAALLALFFSLLYFSINPDKEPLIIHPKSEFILKTEKLIADLSEKNPVDTKSDFQSIDYNQTEPTLVITEVEKLSYQESEEDISQSLESSPQPVLPVEPAWKQELDVFLKGNDLGFAFGQPTFATALKGSDTPYDGNYAFELYYNFQVTDNIAVTPALFYLSRPMGQNTRNLKVDGTGYDGQFNVFGGLIQTTFKF